MFNFVLHDITEVSDINFAGQPPVGFAPGYGPPPPQQQGYGPPPPQQEGYGSFNLAISGKQSVYKEALNVVYMHRDCDSWPNGGFLYFVDVVGKAHFTVLFHHSVGGASFAWFWEIN